MYELVKINKSKIANQEVNTVNARELHKFLESGAKFTDWIQSRISEYNFIENQDYTSFSEISEKPKGGRPSKEYFITIDMAKELSMVERNEKGKEARKYFIECERRLRSLMITPEDYPSALRALATEVEAKMKLEQELKEAQPKIDFCNHVIKEAESLRIGEYAKLLSDSTGLTIGSNKLFEFLRKEGFLMVGRDDRERNKPYQKSIEDGLFEFKMERPKPHLVVCVTYITGKGQFELKDKILDYFS